MSRQGHLFEGARLQMTESIELTVASLEAHVRWNDEAAASGVRKRVFVSSMADAFEDHPQVAPWRAEALALLATRAAA